MTSLSLPPDLLKATQASGIWLTALCIQTFDVELPSFKRPLRCRVSGIQAAMQLLQMPKHVPMDKRESEAIATALKDKSQRLEIIEELLWGWCRTKQHSMTWQWISAAGAMQYIGRLQAKILQKSLAIMTQYVQVEVSGLEVQYFQRGEPGPRPSFNFLRGTDAAVLRVRKLSLTPETFSIDAGSNASSTPGAPRSSFDQTSQSAHEWHSGRFSGSAWSPLSHQIGPKPSSTKLSLSGVSLVLRTYPFTWQQQAMVDRRKDGEEFRASSSSTNDVTNSEFHPDAYPIIDLNQELLGVDGEDHIVFSQWEASLRLSIVPPIANRQFVDRQQRMEGMVASIDDDEIPCVAERVVAQGPDARGRAVDPPFTPAPPTERPTSASTVGQSNGRDVITRSLTLRDSLLGGSEDFSMLENVLSGGLEGYDDELNEFSGIHSPQATNGQNFVSKISTSSPPRPFSIQEDTEVDTRVMQDEGNGGEAQGEGGGVTATPVPDTEAEDHDRTPDVEASEDDLKNEHNDNTAELVVDISITLKALITELNAASVGILTRLIDRHLRFSRYGDYWATRPLVPVIGNESKWWQHAGKTLGRYSRSVARRQPSLCLMAARRQARLEYQSLYAQAHSSHQYYCEPGKKWWQLFLDRTAQKLRLKRQEDKKKALQRLKEMERQLDLEQLAHFRFGVAAKHNRVMAKDSQLAGFIVDKIDALVYSRRTEPLGNGVADLLLHRDRPLPPSMLIAPGDVSLVAFRLHLTMICPKLGIALSLKPSKDSKNGESPTHVTTSADVSSSSAGTRRGAKAGERGGTDALRHTNFSYAVISIKGVSLELDSEEGLVLTVQTLEVGHTFVPTAPIEPRILACPSQVCSRVCRAAEFFRYAVTGSVLSESSIPSESSSGGTVMCARVMLLPRHGNGGATVDGVSWVEDTIASASRDDINYAKQNWCPAGFDVTIQMAAVGIVYDGKVVSSLLSLAAACETCTHQPWAWASPGNSTEPGPSDAAPPPSWPPSWPPSLPHRPVFVEEMVETAFAAANIPMLGHFSLPSNTLEVRCPGIALQLPYRHKISAGIFKGNSSTRKLGQDSRLGSGSGSGKPPVDVETHAAAHAVTNSVTSPSSTQPQQVDRQQSGEQHARKSSIVHADTYRPTSAMARGEISWPMGHEDPAGHDDAIIYMFTVAVQNIVVSVTGEEFSMALRGGTARRVETDCYLDIFSYLSMGSRKEIARHIMPTRVMFDPTRRQFTEEVAGVEALEEELREIELVSMAKVWGYPEDMPTIIRSIRSRQAANNPASSDASPPVLQRRPSRSLGLDAASGLAQSMPGLLEDPNQYPLPLIPFFKAAGMRASIAQRLSASPDEPGGSVLACASSIVGVQAWVSPIHVWHLVSLEATVRRMLTFMLGSTLVEKLTASRKSETKECESSGTESVQTSSMSEPKDVQMIVPRPNRRILFTAQVEELSLLWLIGTWTSKGSVGNAADQVRYSRAWGITVKRSDPAFLWAQWLAPVYGVSLARVQAAVRRYRSGTVVANASIEGIIVRDLQLPDVAKHAYVLRPLPARARRLNAWVQNMRRMVLGVTSMSLSQFLWKRAYRKIQLRRQTRLSRTNALLQNPLDGRTSPSGSSLLGPQLMVWYRSVPPSPKHPLPQAEIKAEVGQLLAYVRIKQQASMTAFVTQLAQITQLITSEGKGNGPKGEGSTSRMPYGELRRTVSLADDGENGKKKLESDKAGPRLQSPLRVDIVVVGIDVLFRVQSRDLMSLKMQQGRVTLDKKAVTRHSGPGDIRLHLSATVQDVMVQDMQADPEHALVLIPNSDAGYCSFDAIYTAQVDPRRYAPCLILEMQNPRVLLLFRFIADLLKATDIISDALSRTKAAGMRASSPKDQEKMPAGSGSNDPQSHRSSTQLQGTTLIDRQQEESKAKPLDVVVQLQNVGIVVPTARTTRTVLAAHLDHLMLAVPGSALPSQLLQDADLPSVEGMLQESLLSNTTFKFGGFHDPVSSEANASSHPHPPPAGGMNHRKDKPETAKDAKDTAAGSTEAPPGQTARGVNGPASSKNKSTVQVKPSDRDNNKQKENKDTERRPGAAKMLRNLLSSTSSGSTSTGHHHQAGVLFLDDTKNYEPERDPAGVLHVPPAHGMEQRSQRQMDDSMVDNVLAVPVSVAKHVAGATKRFVGEMVEAVEGNGGRHGEEEGLTSHSKHAVVIKDLPNRGKQEATGGRVETPEVALPADRDADDTTKLRWIKNSPVQPELPKPLLALCIEDFRILTGALVKIPGYYQKVSSKGRKTVDAYFYNLICWA